MKRNAAISSATLHKDGTNHPVRCVIYVRVSTSTSEKGQDTANQLIQLQDYAERQRWQIVGVYEDHLSGKTGDREAFRRLFEDASRRRFDVVLVWALDRLTREGVFETFDYIRKLTGYGVAFESYTEAHFRTTGPAGELMLAIAAWIAKQERIRISDRTRAGLERAKRQGKVLGRRPVVFRRDEALRLRQEGKSLRAIADQLGVSYGTINNFVKQTSPSESGSGVDRRANF